MFTRFTPPARQTLVRAGTLAIQAGRPALPPDFILLALAEVRPFDLASFTTTPEALRPLIDTGNAVELLATLGIDLEAVRRRMPDQPDLWRLTRSRLNFLRVTLDGPLGSIPLEMHSRKVVEVALWHRPGGGAVTGEDLLWGLLADKANGAARLLRRTGVDLQALVREARAAA